MKIRKNYYAYHRGVLKFSPHKHQFQMVTEFPSTWPLLQNGAPPGRQSFMARSNKNRWIYFANPLPLIRVPATASVLATTADYQANTCLQPGSDAQHPRLNHEKNGTLRWLWQTNTGPVNPWIFARWPQQGKVKARQYIVPLRAVTTGKPVIVRADSVAWNPYLNRWLLIGESTSAMAATTQKRMIDGKPWVCTAGIYLRRIGNREWMVVNNDGSGSLEDIYATVGDTPLGPWVYAQRIVDFPLMSFYNPSQDVFFNRHGGRRVFLKPRTVACSTPATLQCRATITISLCIR